MYIMFLDYSGKASEFESFYRSVLPKSVPHLERSKLFPVEYAMILLSDEHNTGRSGIRKKLASASRSRCVERNNRFPAATSVGSEGRHPQYEFSEKCILSVIYLMELLVMSAWHTYILYCRHRAVYVRSWFGLRLIFIRNVTGSVIIGALYYRNGAKYDKNDPIIDIGNGLYNEYSYNLYSLMFLIIIALIFSAGTSIQSFHEAQKVHLREQVPCFSVYIKISLFHFIPLCLFRHQNAMYPCASGSLQYL